MKLSDKRLRSEYYYGGRALCLRANQLTREYKERKTLKKTIDFECPIISCAAKPGEPCKDGNVFHTLRVLESIKTDMNSEENKIRYGQTDGNGVPLPKRVNP